jgi:hypothetical protein
MKHPLIFLLLMIFIWCFMISCIGFFIEWLLTDKTILQLNWVRIFKNGGVIGCILGIGNWLMLRFNLHQLK